MKKLMTLFLCGMVAAILHAQISTSWLSSYEGLSKQASKIRKDFYLGAFASGLNPLREDGKEVGEIFKHNFNILTAGIYMSGSQREQGSYNLENVDALVNYANSNKIKVYFHPMIGGAIYSPKWLNNGNFSKEELEKIMRDRITTILTRYKKKVHYVDVVNEALNRGVMTNEGEFDWRTEDGTGKNVWMEMGMYQGKKYKFPQYLVDAFKICREAGGKKLKLVLHEYANATTKSSRGITFLNLIKAMKEEGIPVDDAGIQLHCTIRNGAFSESGKEPFDFDAFDEMLKMYEEAEIDVHITEFDIYMPDNPTKADFDLQGEYYAKILQHAIQSPAVKSFKTWGFTDRNPWNRSGPEGYPLLLDKQLQPKPAYIKQDEMLKALVKARK